MATKSEPRTPLKDDDNWVIGVLALHYTKEALLVCLTDFEVAKCFMPAGYSEKTTWEEIDFGGLLAVLTNIKDLKPSDLFPGRSRFPEWQLCSPWFEEVHHDIYQQTHFPGYQMTHRIASLRNFVAALLPRAAKALQALDELLNYSLISIDPFMKERKHDLLELEKALEEMKTKLMVTSCDGFESVLRKHIPRITELLNDEKVLKTWRTSNPWMDYDWEYDPWMDYDWEYEIRHRYQRLHSVYRSTRDGAKSYIFLTKFEKDVQVAFVYEEEPKLRETKSTGLTPVVSGKRPQKDSSGKLKSLSRSKDIISQETLALQQTEGTELASKAQLKSPQEESTGEIKGTEVSETAVECTASLGFLKGLLTKLNVKHAIQAIKRDSSSHRRMVWWDARVRNIPTGTKQVEFTLTCEKADHENVIRRPMRRVCNELFRLETKEVTFKDFELESSQFKKLLLLDAVCEAFRKEHDHNIEAFASTSKDDQLVIIALNAEKPLKEEKPLPEIQEYRGFKVIQFKFYEVSKESLRAENYARKNDWQNTPDDKEKLSKIIALHTDFLFEAHSNLEIIGASAVKSTEGGHKKQPTITLYCRCKSFIPYGEKPFPKILKDTRNGTQYDTDVREGYFTLGPGNNSFEPSPSEFHKELSMGCSIGPEEVKISASVGPFAELKDDTNTYFLTVRHLFQPLDKDGARFEGCRIVQPAKGDKPVNFYNRRPRAEEESLCGEVVKTFITDEIDVALIRIFQDRSPNRGYFILPSQSDLEFAGFSLEDFPRFDDGCVLDATKFTKDDYATERVIKFGKTTGLTKGTLELHSTGVKVFPDSECSIQHNGKIDTRTMKKQLRINSHHHSKSRRFFEPGDSGSAVFLVDKGNKLYCIGIAIGSDEDGYTVVTPIQSILESLSREVGVKVTLKHFKLERMEED